jgi:hypothetical protein
VCNGGKHDVWCIGLSHILLVLMYLRLLMGCGYDVAEANESTELSLARLLLLECSDCDESCARAGSFLRVR